MPCCGGEFGAIAGLATLCGAVLARGLVHASTQAARTHARATGTQVVSGVERCMIAAECEVSYQYNAVEQAKLARAQEEALWQR